MKRRTFATVASGVLTGLAGCLGGQGGSDESTTGAPTTAEGTTMAESTTAASSDLSADADGYPESVDAKPEDRAVDTSGLDTVRENGVDVPLLPVEDAYVWWAYRRARFADARGPDQHANSHVVGAVSSPAAADMRDDDPVAEWPKSDPIVCYCGCPHHLSSIRASQLINEGYENVYVIDEGFFEWRDLDYPVTSGDDAGINRFVVEGRIDASYADENAWVRTVDSEQAESTNVAADGSFELHCKFVDVTADTRLRVETPAWARTGTVAELRTGILTDGE